MNHLKTLFTIFSYTVAALFFGLVTLLFYPFLHGEHKIFHYIARQIADLERHVDQLETNWQNQKK